MGRRIKLGTILLAGMLTLGPALLLFNVRKARACEPPCTLTCTNNPSSQTICDGGSATFTCTNSGGYPDYTYSWTGPNGFSANTAAITINPAHAADAGTYSCIVTDINNCAAQDSGTLKVVGVQSVTPDSPTICGGSPTVTLTAVPVGDDNFPTGSPAWGNISYDPDCNGCIFSTNGTATATFTPAANYAGTATISVSCGTSSATTQIVVIGVVSLTNSPAGKDIGGGTNVYCVGNNGSTITVSATLTSTNNLPNCYSLTKNGSPLGQVLNTTVDQSVPGSTTIIATAGTSSITNTIVVVGVGSLTASPAGTMNGVTNVYCIADSGVITVTAAPSPDPNMLASQLPDCWTLTKNGVIQGDDKLHTTVDLRANGLTKVIATAGASVQTCLVLVVAIESLEPDSCNMSPSAASETEGISSKETSTSETASSFDSTSETTSGFQCNFVIANEAHGFTSTQTLEANCASCVIWKVVPEEAGKVIPDSSNPLKASFTMAKCALPGSNAIVRCSVGSSHKDFYVIESSPMRWDPMPTPDVCPSGGNATGTPLKDDCGVTLKVDCVNGLFKYTWSSTLIGACVYDCGANAWYYRHTTRGSLRFTGAAQVNADHNGRICGKFGNTGTCTVVTPDCTTGALSCPTGWTNCEPCGTQNNNPTQDQPNVPTIVPVPDGTPNTGQNANKRHYWIYQYNVFSLPPLITPQPMEKAICDPPPNPTF